MDFKARSGHSTTRRR